MIPAPTDAKYVQLQREYAKALQAYKNAIEDRRRLRERLAAQRHAQPAPRRPVGSPSDFKIPQASIPQYRPPTQQREKSIYLGKILGYAKIIYTTSPTTGLDPSASFDVDKAFDETSLRLYWNAKEHYLRCKKAFRDYARQLADRRSRQQIQQHRAAARMEFKQAATAQLLGADELGEAALARAQAEVEKACQQVWAIYQRSPSPKSDEAKLELLLGLQDVQLVGLEGTAVGRAMADEVGSFLEAGKLEIGQH